jgi:diguanylate cyclase (GGDEF)-like protein/PAS domain S-box-containing protein
MSVEIKPQTSLTEAQKADYHFWLTFQHALVAMALVTPDGRIQRANPEFQRIIGYSERQLRELGLRAITHADDIEAEMQEIEVILESEDDLSYRIAKSFTRRDNSLFRAQVSATLARDDMGRPHYFIYMAVPLPELPGLRRRTTGKLEDKLADADSREGQIINTFDDAAILNSPKGTIMGWNIAAERIYGYPAEDAVGKPISVLAPARQEEWQRILDAAGQGEIITAHEMVHLTSSDSEILVSLNVTPLVDDKGQLTGILTVARNITEHRLLTDEVQENRNVMSQALEGLPVALYLADAEGVPFYANEAAFDLLGRGIIPRNHKAVAHPLFVAGTDDPYLPENMPAMRALAGEVIAVDNMEVHRPSGITPVQAWAEPIYDAAGQIIYVLATFREISDRRSAEGALLTVRDRFKAVCDNITDFISIYDLRGQYLYASNVCSRLLGYAPEEMVGTDIRIYIHPDDLPVISKTFGRYFAGSDENMRATYRVLRKDGTYIWIETAARPVLGTYGLKREILGVSRSMEETPDLKATLVEERRRPLDDEREREEADLRDRLTGIKNRRAIDAFLSKKLGSRRTSSYPIGFLLLDIDNLKEINEGHGRQVGDDVIKRVAEAIRSTCRSEDFVGRLTGDEFLVVLPNTDASGTVVVGERLVANVRNALWTETPVAEGVTVSVGGTCIVRYSGLTESGLIEILDSQLYEAKQGGRNRFIMNARRMAGNSNNSPVAARQ